MKINDYIIQIENVLIYKVYMLVSTIFHGSRKHFISFSGKAEKGRYSGVFEAEGVL